MTFIFEFDDGVEICGLKLDDVSIGPLVNSVVLFA
jgi:hypothetical protein